MTHFAENMSKAERKENRDLMLCCLRKVGGNTFVLPSDKVVIAVEPLINTPDCNMFKVAIAYCNESDKFKKSTGELIALYRLQQSGNYTLIKSAGGMSRIVFSVLQCMR